MKDNSSEKINYQLLLDKQLSSIKNTQKIPSLLLHACCAPCSSCVLEYLTEYFDITLFFYNPNISSAEEYEKRAKELGRLINEMPLKNKVSLIVPPYTPEEFENIARGKENEPEKGSRCSDCYMLRLKKTFELAKDNGFDYFSTTLSISPHKDAKRLNDYGTLLAGQDGTSPIWLYSDFKKKNGYKRSCELSEQYNLYRQNFCGCVYSRK